MKRSWDHNKEVHRRFKADRYHPQRGDDWRELEQSTNARGRPRGIDEIKVNGVASADNVKHVREVARAFGLHLVLPGVTKRTQRKLRLEEPRTKAELKRAHKRERKAAKKRVHKPKEDYVRYVRNRSIRTSKIRLIVLHDTEGANIKGVSDLVNLGGWFDNPAAQASSTIAVDAEGNTGRYVRDRLKAWHAAAYNSPALGIEQVGFASQKEWPEAQLRKVAKWIAYWSVKYDIPIAHSTIDGVALHSDLGAAGGGHHDPGPNYPLDRVLDMARDYVKNGW